MISGEDDMLKQAAGYQWRIPFICVTSVVIQQLEIYTTVTASEAIPFH